MSKWMADFIINPSNYHDFVVEILCNEIDVAFVSQGKNGLELKWYPHDKDLVIPFDWLLELMIKINEKIKSQETNWKFEKINK
jgi:hypothetical protein